MALHTVENNIFYQFSSIMTKSFLLMDKGIVLLGKEQNFIDLYYAASRQCTYKNNVTGKGDFYVYVQIRKYQVEKTHL